MNQAHGYKMEMIFGARKYAMDLRMKKVINKLDVISSALNSLKIKNPQRQINKCQFFHHNTHKIQYNLLKQN